MDQMTQHQNTELTPCWYVKDFADGWIKFYDVDMAIHEAKETEAIMCYSSDGSYPSRADRPAAMSGDRVSNAVIKQLDESIGKVPDWLKSKHGHDDYCPFCKTSPTVGHYAHCAYPIIRQFLTAPVVSDVEQLEAIPEGTTITLAKLKGGKFAFNVTRPDETTTLNRGLDGMAEAIKQAVSFANGLIEKEKAE